jgi:hypothetical protein
MTAANILNKESQTTDKKWSFILWTGWELTTAYRKRQAYYKMLYRALDFLLINKILSHFKGRTQIYVSITELRRLLDLRQMKWLEAKKVGQ